MSLPEIRTAHEISDEEAKSIVGEVEERLRRAAAKAVQVEALFAGSRLECIGSIKGSQSVGRRSSRRPLAHLLSPCWPCRHCQPNRCGLKRLGWPRQRCERFEARE